MIRRLSVTLVFSLLVATHALAQLASQTALVGTVTDSGGLLVPGAQVVAVNVGTRDTYEATRRRRPAARVRRPEGRDRGGPCCGTDQAGELSQSSPFVRDRYA